MMSETELENQEIEPAGQPELPDQAQMTSNSRTPTAGRPNLLWTLFIFVIGGLVGWAIGRESAAGSTTSAITNPIVVATPAAVVTEPTAVAGLPTAPAAASNSSQLAASIAPAGPTPATIRPETLRTMGDPDAPVTIVEFSDYQCPFCLRHFQQTFPQLKTEYIDTGRVYYVFKDFPITSLHPVAPRVHEAARCAGELGSTEVYWQVHDSFFNNQQQWADKPQPDLDNTLVGLMADLDLPEADMRVCLESGRYTDAVNTDLAEGQALGVNGTPTFFVNGYPISGAQPYELFQRAIALAEEGRLGAAYTQAPGPNDGIAQATATALAARPVDVPVDDEPTLGSPDAPVTIVEYSDFQCPFCRRHFDNTLPQLQAYIDTGQVYYVFKDFPLHSIHPQAQKAHESARCARELGGDESFWTMHDLLFINQDDWGGKADHVEVFKSLAAEAGLPQAEFNECLDSGRYAAAVNVDVAEGQGFGINGTPTFFINGQRLVGAQPFAVFQQAIEAIIRGE
ncbi:MAG: thioredoxin domain-containing protein [Chloroflexota bacterium]